MLAARQPYNPIPGDRTHRAVAFQALIVLHGFYRILSGLIEGAGGLHGRNEAMAGGSLLQENLELAYIVPLHPQCEEAPRIDLLAPFKRLGRDRCYGIRIHLHHAVPGFPVDHAGGVQAVFPLESLHAVQGVFIEIAVDENLGNLVVKIRDDGQIILGDPYRVAGVPQLKLPGELPLGLIEGDALGV